MNDSANTKGKAMELSERERAVIGEVLRMVQDRMGAAGCNDLPDPVEDMLSPKEWEAFMGKAGVDMDGGFPMDFDVVRVAERFINPTERT